MGGDATAEGNSEEPFECRRVRRPFVIARFPVTVQQYQLFVEDGGYADDSYWLGPARKWLTGEARDWGPDQWVLPEFRERYLDRHFPIQYPEDYSARFQAPNSPRVGISWFEADAYVRWLQHRFHEEEWGFGPGWKPMLASEAEWELAARWDGRTTDRVVPWDSRGSDDSPAGRCNYKGAGIDGTTPVGLFSPEGDAHCGASDLLGNVWEWCRNPWMSVVGAVRREAYNRADESQWSGSFFYPALRGGAWIHDAPEILRCATRRGLAPGYVNAVVGFRVVCVRVSASGE